MLWYEDSNGGVWAAADVADAGYYYWYFGSFHSLSCFVVVSFGLRPGCIKKKQQNII